MKEKPEGENPWIVLREKQKKTPLFFILEIIRVCLNFAGMQKSKDCETCGNPIPAQAFTCRFCNASQSVENFLQKLNKLWNPEVFEGFFAKRIDSPSPRQLRSPNQESPHWVKRSWDF